MFSFSCLHVVEEVSLLPGAPVAIETLEMRLSGENRVEDSFGPELPPVMKGTEILHNVDLVYREIFAPCFIFVPIIAIVVSCKFNTGQIPFLQVISLLAQLHLGKFKTGQNCLQV